MCPCPSAPRLSAPAGLALLAIAAITSWFHRHTRWVVTQLLLAITLLHSPYGVCAMAAIAAAWLAWRRHALGTNGHA